MSFANAAMLLGLLGVAIPVVIHLLSRRRVPTIDWGAMQFLDLGPRARTRSRLLEWLLLLTRMLLLGLVALAAARPIWSGGVGPVGGEGRGPRDLVIVVDGSAGMARRGGGSSPMRDALRRIEAVIDRLGPADSVAIVRAGDRARAVLDPPTIDRGRIREALDSLPGPRGVGNLPAALGEAFRILEQSARHPSGEVLILTDGDRNAWRVDDRGRWRLLRLLHEQLPNPPRISVETFRVPTDPGSADGEVVEVLPARPTIAPGGTIRVSAVIRNLGPGTLERSAELAIDGDPLAGSTRAVGPLAPGASATVDFRADLSEIGPAVMAVRLVPGGTPDPLPLNDDKATVVEVAEALPVLLVDGEPGPGPMAGEVDFLRAALMPLGDETPQVRAAVLLPDALNVETLAGQRVLVLANVDRLGPDALRAVSSWVARGGGVLAIVGDRTDTSWWNQNVFRDGAGWLPARIGPPRGRFADRLPVARPSPPSRSGGSFGAGGGESLASASLFGFFELEPALGGDRPASVLARLDSGEPWLVERPIGSGRAALLAGPLDAEGGTLPANPDFVPFAYELVFRLAGAGAGPPPSPPGTPLVVPIDADEAEGRPPIAVRTPSGRSAGAVIDQAGDGPVARFDETDEPGLYRLDLPGGPVYRAVAGSAFEPSPLSADEARGLAEGWPLAFDLAGEPGAPPSSIADPGPSRPAPRPLWRGVVLLALAALCVEVWLTRRLARRRGAAAGSHSR